MIKKLFSKDEIDIDQWKSLVETSALSNVFQTPSCFDLYCGMSFLVPFVVAVSDGDFLKGLIVGFIQKDGGSIMSAFSRRAIINGGPLLSNDCSEELLSALLSACREMLKHKVIYIETRNFNDYSKYKDVFEKNGFGYEPHYNFHLNTSDPDMINKMMHQNPKRTIKSSLKMGAEIFECTSAEDMNDWYGILLRLYKERVHTPLFPKEFFDKAFKSSIIKLLAVRYNGKVVGGGLYVIGRDCVYEWFICGLDGLYRGVCPSTLGTYAGIRYAADHGLSRFDFMGAGAPGDGGYGVRDFKAKFGGELVEHGRYLSVQNRLLYGVGKLAVKIMKEL